MVHFLQHKSLAIEHPLKGFQISSKLRESIDHELVLGVLHAITSENQRFQFQSMPNVHLIHVEQQQISKDRKVILNFIMFVACFDAFKANTYQGLKNQIASSLM